MEELTKTMLERGAFHAERDRSKIPMTLLDSVMARLDGLGSAKETTQWAAALGREFSCPILQVSVSNDEEQLQGNLMRLIENKLVMPVDVSPHCKIPSYYMFKHSWCRKLLIRPC
jgi:predicted ATPase